VSARSLLMRATAALPGGRQGGRLILNGVG